jgi:hypothetical protein
LRKTQARVDRGAGHGDGVVLTGLVLAELVLTRRVGRAMGPGLVPSACGAQSVRLARNASRRNGSRYGARSSGLAPSVLVRL